MSMRYGAAATATGDAATPVRRGTAIGIAIGIPITRDGVSVSVAFAAMRPKLKLVTVLLLILYVRAIVDARSTSAASLRDRDRHAMHHVNEQRERGVDHGGRRLCLFLAQRAPQTRSARRVSSVIVLCVTARGRRLTQHHHLRRKRRHRHWK